MVEVERSPSPVRRNPSDPLADPSMYPSATGSEKDYLSDSGFGGAPASQSGLTNAQRGTRTETLNEAEESYLELEDEMEIEQALAKLNARLESLRGADRIMKIGNN